MISLSLEPELDFSASEYAGLFAASSATAFQHPEWLGAITRNIAPERGAELLTITGRDDTGALVLVVPLVRRVVQGVAIVECIDFGVTDYAAPVIRAGLGDKIAARKNLSEEVFQLIGRCDIFRVKAAKSEHAAFWGAVSGTGMDQAAFSAHSVELGSPYDQWRIEAFGKSFAKYIDRRRKRFEKPGTSSFQLISDAREARQAIGELAQLRSGRFDSDPIQDDCIREFYAGVAAAGTKTGFARTYRLADAGETLGIVFGTVHDGIYHYLLIGCDYDRFSKHSPGLLMYDSIMEDWLNDGGKVFDFTIGDEAFKAKFGTSPVAVFTTSKATTLPGKLAMAAKGVKSRIAGLRKSIQAPPIAPAVSKSEVKPRQTAR